MSQFCLVGLLGVSLACFGGGDKKAVVSDGCQVFAQDIKEATQPFSQAELQPMKRPRKEALVRLKKKNQKLCP